MSDFKVPPKAKGFKRLFKALFILKTGLNAHGMKRARSGKLPSWLFFVSF